jgi:hypothetical protein
MDLVLGLVEKEDEEVDEGGDLEKSRGLSLRLRIEKIGK